MGSDLHHSGGAVGGYGGAVYAGAVDAAGENMGPAVLTAENGPLGEYGKTVQWGRAAGGGNALSQNPVVEGDIDAIMMAIEGNGFYTDVGVDQFGAAYPDIGGGIQQLLGAGG